MSYAEDVLIPRLRVLLKDAGPESERWTDAELLVHLERALDEVSRVLPEEVMTVLATLPGSREIDIAGLEGLVRVEAVEWPVGLFPPVYVRFQVWGRALTLLTAALPAAAEDVHVYWGRRHDIGGETTSLPETAVETLLAGAAGYAARSWAAFAANRANVSGSEAVRQYERLAGAWLEEFAARLRRLGRAGRLRTAVLYRPAAPPARDAVSWQE